MLRALNAFFNFSDEKNDFNNLSHQYNPRTTAKITITFDDVAGTQFASISSQNKLKIQFTYKNKDDEPKYRYYKSGKFNDLHPTQKKRLFDKFKFIYVPIVRDYNTAILGEHGTAYRLLKKIFEQQTENRDTINPFLDNFYLKMEKTVFKNTLKQIEQYYPFSNECSFELQRKNFDLVDSLLKNIALKMIEKTQSVEIGNCGSGIQSAIYFAISLAHAVNSNDVDYLVGIDEPELNMHPQAQKELIASLLDKNKYPKTSFLLTTHSTVIIDELGHDAIVLCRKRNLHSEHKGKDVPGQRAVYTEMTQVSSDFFSKYKIEQSQYDNFFEFKNSDFFYTNYLIITESPNDCRVYEHLIKQKGTDTEREGITFIPSNGVTSVKYPYALAKELNIPFFLIVDRDAIQLYQNGTRLDSLDSTGIPQYKNEFNRTLPIASFFSKEDIKQLDTFSRKNDYLKQNKILKKYNVMTMQYALEVDLIANDNYTTEFCDVLNVTQADKRNKLSLLKDKCNVIKKSHNVIAALEKNNLANIPASYNYIVKMTKDMLKIK